MTKIVKLAAAFVAVLLAMPVAGMADEWGVVPDKEPRGIIKLDINKCFYFPDWPDTSKFLWTHDIRVHKRGHDLYVRCKFPYIHNPSSFDPEDHFKCVVLKGWPPFKRTTYDSEFELKPRGANMDCDFERKVRPDNHW